MKAWLGNSPHIEPIFFFPERQSLFLADTCRFFDSKTEFSIRQLYTYLSTGPALRTYSYSTLYQHTVYVYTVVFVYFSIAKGTTDHNFHMP
jgi:hypothetical protein